ncbi:MAG TPA: hypothetical protein VHD63_15105 [Ktedonobacteraceae bacterium]|nr:hypothetical protein [Ktedonobacteraceae bacterium]
MRLGFDVAQEALKSELVGIMIFPSGKIADVPAPAEVSGPVLIGV